MRAPVRHARRVRYVPAPPPAERRPEGEQFIEDGVVRVSLGRGMSIPVSHHAAYVDYVEGTSGREWWEL